LNSGAVGSVKNLLQRALTRLQTENRSISIRSLASRIDVSPSYLSKIFRGERSLPLRLLPALGKALQLDHHEVLQAQQVLLGAVEDRELQNATGIRTLPRENVRVATAYETLGQNDFWLLEEWYHLPILNLVTLKDYVHSPEWIAGRLGITELQARRSLERMLEGGQLLLVAGVVKRNLEKLRFPTQRSHPSVRSFHRAMIERAQKCLKKDPSEKEFNERLISGIAFAADPSKIAQAKVILEEAMYRAAEVLASGECTEVCQLNLQLFPLTSEGPGRQKR
jgi:uncharacterized protein (TIGR02147 family)